MTYGYLADLALILLATKALSMLTGKLQMPQVVGALVAGLVMGPAVLNIIQPSDFLSQVAELGVIVIMFSAGMGTDLNELKQTGKAGFVIAMAGVLVPLVMGTGLMFIFNTGELAMPGNKFLQDLFLGVVLTATSVSITVETLKELGKLSTKVGNAILAAALIDDVLGLVCLTVVTSMAGADVNIVLVLVKILLFFLFAGVLGVVVSKALNWYETKVRNRDLRRYPILAFVLCLFMAWAAEEWFGVADIIGAFAAGLIGLVRTKIETLCDVLGIITDRKQEILDGEIEALIQERQEARKARNFARADEIRDMLAKQGILLEDTREGVKWKRA